MPVIEIACYIVLGALGGLGLTAYVRKKTAHAGVGILSQTLVGVSLVYVAFAMASMEDTWLVVEIGGVLVFLGFAFLGSRNGARWLAAGWFAHILWDVLLHVAVPVDFVPLWYPVACIGFDAAVGCVILWMYALHKPQESAAA